MNRKVEVEPGFDKDLRREDFVRKSRNGNRHRTNNEFEFAPIGNKVKEIIDDEIDQYEWEDDFSDIKDIWDEE